VTHVRPRCRATTVRNEKSVNRWQRLWSFRLKDKAKPIVTPFSNARQPPDETCRASPIEEKAATPLNEILGADKTSATTALSFSARTSRRCRTAAMR